VAFSDNYSYGRYLLALIFGCVDGVLELSLPDNLKANADAVCKTVTGHSSSEVTGTVPSFR
jgi:hypothetical protein